MLIGLILKCDYEEYHRFACFSTICTVFSDQMHSGFNTIKMTGRVKMGLTTLTSPLRTLG